MLAPDDVRQFLQLRRVSLQDIQTDLAAAVNGVDELLPAHRHRPLLQDIEAVILVLR